MYLLVINQFRYLCLRLGKFRVIFLSFFLFNMAFRLPLFRATAAVLAFSFVAACSSKKDDATPAPTTGVSYTVDGGSVTATTAAAVVLGNNVIVQGVSGTGTANKGVSLTLPKRTGTFTLTDTTTIADATYLASGNASDIYGATSGTIVVSTYTASATTGASNIAGTYTFTGKNTAGASKAVTNGKFNVKY